MTTACAIAFTRSRMFFVEAQFPYGTRAGEVTHICQITRTATITKIAR